jgi:nitric oxide reductase NorD protein
MTMPGQFLEDLLRSADYAADIDHRSWDELRAAFPGARFEQWLDALQRIARLPDAPLLIKRFAAASIALANRIGPEACIEAAQTAVALARLSGSGTCIEFLGVLPLVAPEARDPAAFMVWLRTIEELSSLAPECTPVVIRQSAAILARLSVRGFRSWVFNGVHGAKGDAAQRLSYFSHPDAQSLSSFERNEGDVIFADVEKPLRAFCRALWNIQPALRSAPVRPGVKAIRRSSFDGLFFQFPEIYSGYRGSQAQAHYFAATAHMAAHVLHTRQRFAKGSLRPLQVALVGVIEDARVEALAIAEYPGLRRLWLQFHNVQPGPAVSSELMMMRLARALLDPAYADDDPWVQKGRRMFFDRRDHWSDAAMSRDIGNLLGNDLGQMRIQFNSKSYVVEPSYRDDGVGIWEVDDSPPAESEAADMMLEAVRITRSEDKEDPSRTERNDESPQKASMASRAAPAEDDAGVPIARHPEWDHVSGTMRHDWTTVLEFTPRRAPAEQIDALLQQHEDVERRIAKLVRSAKISRPRRMRGQPQGDRLDLDACIRASIERRAGLTPEARVYETSEMLSRDLSVLLLLDVSESTRDRVKDTTTTVLALERVAASLLAQAMHELGDPFAIHAFCSNGRSEVRYYRVKEFHEPYTALTRSALAGLRGMMSTRLGAALRQAGDEIGRQATHRKLILIITDGEPSDIDAPDKAYLVEDARRAVQALSHRGIDVFCVGLESGAESALPRIFGSRNFVKIARIETLPERLPMLYFMLTM